MNLFFFIFLSGTKLLEFLKIHMLTCVKFTIFYQYYVEFHNYLVSIFNHQHGIRNRANRWRHRFINEK